jgi:hypothetical protein
MVHGYARPWFVRACTAALLLLPVSACKEVSRPPDPLVGTWTLNVQKSKFSPGVPRPQSMTMMFEQTSHGLHAVSVVVLRDGTSSRNEYTAAYDDKDYPITGVDKVDTVQMKQIDALTSERIDKRAGQRVQSYTRQVYADGRTLLVTQKGADASGSHVDHMMIFEKKDLSAESAPKQASK